MLTLNSALTHVTLSIVVLILSSGRLPSQVVWPAGPLPVNPKVRTTRACVPHEALQCGSRHSFHLIVPAPEEPVSVSRETMIEDQGASMAKTVSGVEWTAQAPRLCLLDLSMSSHHSGQHMVWLHRQTAGSLREGPIYSMT